MIDCTLSTVISAGISPDYPSGHLFGSITAGGMWSRFGIHDNTSHLKTDGEPWGGNIGFLDGHVTWRPFSQMKDRYGNPHFWW